MLQPGLQAPIDRHTHRVLRAATLELVEGGRVEGAFIEPTIVDGVTRESSLFREEVFGPLLSVTTFSSVSEAIALANDTPFGLAAYFYARDVGRIFRVAEAIEAGIIGINEGLISTEVAPFGGVKESGLGREGSHYGIEEYLEIKYLALGGIGT